MSNLNIAPLFTDLELKRPIIMAGPCSAETEIQTLETARLLAMMGIRLFRAGIWKPRTRPGTFEGVGVKGLMWLKKVRNETGMRTGVEVANALHVHEALQHEIDFVWIGARTSANPFAVQEIADALRGADIPVFVKNPVNPDLELWIGALERINGAGITQLGAIHRGFSTYGISEYRNHPQWQIPIELHRRIPALPIIIDPSHIGGKRKLLPAICQEAMDLNFDGLIIEVHINPEEAWSDAGQQVTPVEVAALLNRLILRNPEIKNILGNELDELRRQIDIIDNQLLDILSERMKISDAIGRYKQRNNITILQSRRYNEIMNNRICQATAKGLNPDFTTGIFESIHEESINRQNIIMNSELND
ncbi:MAG: bifunctional 3-deoxy-7-phosphoheptulonate synthase/chorismate mutase type II [Cytophagaceae bacterium]|jgi:chorismate mutase|nr:bifunctional 3-deoxy-7-phosphoheptulonate synthase/chorismate mutase type II [Cytophagaceae bacterium]